jgi:hypothetical protein
MMRSLVAVLALALTTGGLAEQDTTTRLLVPGRANANPWIAAERSFVVVAWSATGSDGADVYVAVSRDAGSTFGDPVRVNKRAGDARAGGELPPRVALASTDGDEPHIVITWGGRDGVTEIRMSQSRDGGRTFGAHRVLNAAGAAGDRGWHATAVDRGGVAHTIWLDHRGLAARKKTEHDHHGDGADMAQYSGLFYAAGDGSEREVAKSVCYCCKTSLVIGGNGALHAAWRHVYPGNIRDIAFATSRDGGKTFSPPVRVSEDRWHLAGCPDDGPAMAAGPDGVVHLVWPTVVTDEDGNQRGSLFYASTADGVRFSPRVAVPTLGSLKPSHPQIVADEQGGLIIGWDEVRGGTRRASARRLRFSATGAPIFGDVISLEDAAASAYPVFAATSRGVFAAWTHGVGASSEIRVRRVAD